jgi:3-deoxy-manno-octulosonate cytidylyltransferase (CMP-KDO synthetase)
MNDLKCIAIIPARFASTRFPGKPLVEIAGKPMIQHVYERVSRAELISEVIVATDDERIQKAVTGFGGKVQMTSAKHRSGTERVAEVAFQSEAEVIVNVQGDEPLIDPRCIDRAIEPFFADPELCLSTLQSPSNIEEELLNPNVVKVVTDHQGYALYFSRAPIPFFREGIPHNAGREPFFYKHIGLYGYRKKFLEQLAGLRESNLEKAECLEQLRFLENGFRMKVITVDYQVVSVDIPEDLERVRQIFKGAAHASAAGKTR